LSQHRELNYASGEYQPVAKEAESSLVSESNEFSFVQTFVFLMVSKKVLPQR